MSVVNKVLQDLDARHAGASDRVGVPSAVTPLSVHLAKKRPISLLIIGVLLLAIAASAMVWILRPGLFSRAPKVDAVAAPENPVSRPIAIAAPSAVTAAPSATHPTAVVAPVVVAAPPSIAPQPLSSANEPKLAELDRKPARTVQAEPKQVKALPDRIRTSGHFIQIGAFSSRENAMALGEQLKRDVGPLAGKVLVFSSGRLTLVQLGPWSDSGEASNAANILRDKHGISSAPVLKPQRLPDELLLASVGEIEALPTPKVTVPAVPRTASAKTKQRKGKDVEPATDPAENGEEAAGAQVAPVQENQPANPQAIQQLPTVTAGRNSKAPAAPNDGHIDKRSRVPTAIERAETTYRRGVLIHRQGQLEDAAALFRAALEDNVDHAAARQSLAGLLIDAKRFDEAEAVLRKGVELGAVRLPSVLALARLKVERNQVPAALDLLQQNIDAGERSADYQGFMGALLNRIGRHREASDRYQMATQLAPSEGRWWAALGIALEAQGRNSEARESYQKARNLPGLPPELEQHIEQRLR